MLQLVWQTLMDVSQKLTSSIIVPMMKAVSSPEDSHLRIRRRENLKISP
jgi:hypothetical protein